MPHPTGVAIKEAEAEEVVAGEVGKSAKIGREAGMLSSENVGDPYSHFVHHTVKSSNFITKDFSNSGDRIYKILRMKK